MRYSPVVFGGRKMAHSEVSPATPFEKVVVLKENHDDLVGRAAITLTRVSRHHKGDR